MHGGQIGSVETCSSRCHRLEQGNECTFSDREIFKFQQEEKDGRKDTERQGPGHDDLALHPVSGEMIPVCADIIPGQETDAAGDDEQHDRNVDERLICVGGQGGKCPAVS